MLVMLEIMDVLNSNPNIILDDTADANEERTAEPEPNEKGEIRVWGNLVAFVERLDDEMFKSLQVGCCWLVCSSVVCSSGWGLVGTLLSACCTGVRHSKSAGACPAGLAELCWPVPG